LFEAFIGRRFTVDPAGGKRTTWDSTVAPGATRRWRVRVGELGEALPGEALAFELRYVYTADEAPRRHRHPGEPTWRTVSEQRMLLEEMESCTR
jgi:hypothetical protein